MVRLGRLLGDFLPNVAQQTRIQAFIAQLSLPRYTSGRSASHSTAVPLVSTARSVGDNQTVIGG